MKTTAITTLLPAASAVGQPGIVADYTNQLRGGGGAVSTRSRAESLRQISVNFDGANTAIAVDWRSYFEKILGATAGDTARAPIPQSLDRPA